MKTTAVSDQKRDSSELAATKKPTAEVVSTDNSKNGYLAAQRAARVEKAKKAKE
jgi:hypothetical protein